MNEICDLDSNCKVEQQGKSPAGGGDYTTERNRRTEDNKESQLFQRLLVIVKNKLKFFF